MITLFNKEQIFEAYIAERVEEKVAERKEIVAREEKQAIAINLHNMGMDVTFIAKALNQSVEIVKAWLGMVTEQ